MPVSKHMYDAGILSRPPCAKSGSPMKRLIAAAALLCLSVVAANAQAFGVTKSTPLDQLQASKAADADALWLITPPNPNAAFASYGVNYSETMGICSVGGTSKFDDVEAGKYAADDVVTMLSDLYGHGYESLDPKGDYWSWDGGLPDGVELIELFRTADTLAITYAFDGQDECYRSLHDTAADNTGL